MTENNGWIKIHRRLMENPIYQNPHLLHLFIHCLLRANHKEQKFIFNGEEITVKRGQFITGRLQLSKELNQKCSSVYKRLSTLSKLNILNIKSNNKFSLISIIKYSTYQDDTIQKEQQKEQQSNNKVTTKEQQSNTNKNDKNDKNVKKTDCRMEIRQVNIQTQMKFVFEEHYLQTKGVRYYYSGKCAGALKQILSKLRNICHAHKQTDNDILTAFKFMITNIHDEWINDNLDLSIINSKFNQIISQIRNGKTTETKPGNTKGFDIRKNTWFTGINQN